MGLVARDRNPDGITGVERAVEVKLGSLGGFELRPSRLFVWKGPARSESEKLVPIAERPAALDYKRRETTTKAGGVEVRTRGNPLMTIALAGALAFKRWADPQDPPGDGR